MEKKSMKLLLIEDDTIEYNKFRELAQRRNDIEFIGITNSAPEAIKYVKKYMPEGIILDLELHYGEGDGFQFLQELRKLKMSFSPKVVVTTNVCSGSVYDYLHEQKVDFIFYKKQDKYSVEHVINTLLILRDYKDGSIKNNVLNIPNKDNEEEVSKMISDKINIELDLIGVSTHLQGRKYLHDGILYLLMNANDTEKISIIQHLSSKYKKASSTISRAMQNAILHAWRISAPDDIEEYYTARINYETGNPTPMEFIYYYVDKIKKSI